MFDWRIIHLNLPTSPQVYTLAVVYFLVAVHRQQRRLSAGLPPSDAEQAEEAALWAFEKEVLAARKAAERQRREEKEQRERELLQRKQQAVMGDAHPLSDGAVAAGGAAAGAAQRCVGGSVVATGLAAVGRSTRP